MGTSHMKICDGTPCAVKVACTVWARGKDGDCIKVLPIGILNITDITAVERCLRRLGG